MAEQTVIPSGAAQLPAALSQIVTQNATLQQLAESLVVDGPDAVQQANDLLAEAARREKVIHEQCDPVCDATNKAHKAATDQRTRLLAVPKAVRILVAQKVGRWQSAERERQAEIDRKARELAQRQADEQRLALAEKAEKIGDAEMADKLLEEIGRPAPPAATPVIGSVPAPKRASTGESVSVPSVWKARPTGEDSLDLLIEAAAKDRALRKYLGADMSALNASAKLDGKAFRVPGFEAYEDFTSRVR